ncbi:MAG: aspartate/glutamate racemase family protein [Elsteraceae bacterium]
MTRLALINPNTSAETTATMVEIARESAAGKADIVGFTAPFGASLITTPDALAESAKAVMALAPELKGNFDGAIVAAFGDPAVLSLKDALECPVTGIAEAGMLKADEHGRAFAVVTTTPRLVEAIAAAADGYGHRENFRGIRLTPGDPAEVMADPDRLLKALAIACQEAIDQLGAEALIIGGGPLARAARALQPHFAVPIIEPVPEAVRLAISRAKGYRLAHLLTGS